MNIWRWIKGAVNKIKGVIDAGNLVAAKQKLREGNLFPIELNETGERNRETDAAPSGILGLFGKVGFSDISIMTRQLATLLGAGLPLVPSLAISVSQAAHPQLKKTLARIKEEVN